jgi:pimeloyl-ACP methyl ester carboxylesterase
MANQYFIKINKTLLKIAKIVCIIIFSLFVLLSIIPYLIPVNQGIIYEKNLPFKESQFLYIDGKRWHYRQFIPKNETKANIILIHGFSGSTFSWRNNQQVLADSGYHVISIDLPAFGYSEKNNNAFDHSAIGHANNIWKLIDSLDLKADSFAVIGHSMGAAVAWSFAGLRPQSILNVFLVDGAGSMGSSKGSWSSSVLKFCMKYPPLLRWADVLGGTMFFKQKKFVKLLNSAYSQKADSVSAAGYLAPFMLKNSGRAVIESFIYNKNHTEPDYTKLKCPVQLIWGSNDKWLPISLGEKFIEKYPSANLYKIEGAGHCPMETHSKDFNSYILGFFK